MRPATRSILTGTSFGDNILAVLPGVIGRTVGGMIERSIAGGRDTSGAPEQPAENGGSTSNGHVQRIGSGKGAYIDQPDGVSSWASADEVGNAPAATGSSEIGFETHNGPNPGNTTITYDVGSGEYVVSTKKLVVAEPLGFFGRTFGWSSVDQFFSSLFEGGSNPRDRQSKPSYLSMMITGVGNAGTYTPGSMGVPIGARIEAGRGYANAMAYPLTQPLPRIPMKHHWGGGAYTVGGKPDGRPLIYHEPVRVGDVVDAVTLPFSGPLAAELKLFNSASRLLAGGSRFGNLRTQVSSLRSLGVDTTGRRAFFNGDAAQFQFSSTSGESAYGFVQMGEGKLTSQLFSISDKSPSSAVGTILKFRNESMTLARASGVSTLELQGGSVINPKVAAFLARQGAQSKTVIAPDILGGGSQDVYYKVFQVK
jgi:hypothetical protein